MNERWYIDVFVHTIRRKRMNQFFPFPQKGEKLVLICKKLIYYVYRTCGGKHLTPSFLVHEKVPRYISAEHRF
jgi:hypothetical protein